MNLSRFAVIILAIFAFSSVPAFAQSYKTAAGVRVDNGLNLTIQQYITKGWTAEGIVHTPFNSQDLGITVLAEKHRKILFRNLNFYTGAGAHYYKVSDNNQVDVANSSENKYGLSFIGGAELSLGRLNLAVDWKPELHLNGAARPLNWNGASISARYIIEKRERKRIGDWKVWDRFEKKDKRKKR